MAQVITRSEIQQHLDSTRPITLVEALPERFYADGHLPGALNINHDEVEAKAPDLLPNKDAFIVVYCANSACDNSSIAANKLTQLGYRNVRTYAEGKQDWVGAGLQLEKSAGTHATC
ncbi:MAG: rhodanese-like domain-containing protein [Nitrospirota bacterium]